MVTFARAGGQGCCLRACGQRSDHPALYSAPPIEGEPTTAAPRIFAQSASLGECVQRGSDLTFSARSDAFSNLSYREKSAAKRQYSQNVFC
jgi:hypothetical protein